MATVNVPGDYATINAALQAVNNLGGDIIEVEPGTYTEMLDFRNGSGWLIAVTLRAADPTNKPIIASTGATQAVYAFTAPLQAGTSGMPTFEDLIFSGWTAATNGVLYFARITLQSLTVTRCEFVGNTGRTCITAPGTALNQSVIDSCLFKTSGQSIARSTNYVTIRNCVAFPSANTAFEGGAFTTATYVVNNSVYGSWSAGDVMGGALLYYGNVIQNIGAGGAKAINATGGTYTENLAFGTWTTTYAGTDGGGNQTGVDPQFTNPAGFDLTTPDTSPCYRSTARSALALLTYTGSSRSDPTDKGAYQLPDPPTVASASLTAGQTIRVVFSEAMTNDAALILASNYDVDLGLATAVVRINATTVDVTIAARIPAALGAVTVTGPTSVATGLPCDASRAEFAVPYLTLVPPGVVGAGRTSVEVEFNLVPTTGVDSTADWTVEVVGSLGAVVSVLAVAMDTATATLTVWPALSIGASYVITPVNAANAAGPVG